MNDIHEANRRWWDNAAPEWHKKNEDEWREGALQPALAFEGKALEMIQEYLGNLHGKRVCFIASGDNIAAFALAGLGAEVTSTDISQPRLDLAAQRAAELGLTNIRFLRADAADLSILESGSYDLVCSTNGFFVWISDLNDVFREACRVLKPGGWYIFYDIHPFQRPWKEQTAIEVQKSYWQTGPFGTGRPDAPEINYHWTVSDILNALAGSNLVLKKLSEDATKYPSFWTGISLRHGGDPRLLDWRNNPRAALPVWLTAAAQKPG
jgi:ubiquinone/menaquinone biosynthesis C-methylase UbiE